jgi:hypothetical protein
LSSIIRNRFEDGTGAKMRRYDRVASIPKTVP